MYVFGLMSMLMWDNKVYLDIGLQRSENLPVGYKEVMHVMLLIFINCCNVSVQFECHNTRVTEQIDSAWCYQINLHVRNLIPGHVNVHGQLVLW